MSGGTHTGDGRAVGRRHRCELTVRTRHARDSDGADAAIAVGRMGHVGRAARIVTHAERPCRTGRDTRAGHHLADHRTTRSHDGIERRERSDDDRGRGASHSTDRGTARTHEGAAGRDHGRDGRRHTTAATIVSNAVAVVVDAVATHLGDTGANGRVVRLAIVARRDPPDVSTGANRDDHGRARTHTVTIGVEIARGRRAAFVDGTVAVVVDAVAELGSSGAGRCERIVAVARNR